MFWVALDGPPLEPQPRAAATAAREAATALTALLLPLVPPQKLPVQLPPKMFLSAPLSVVILRVAARRLLTPTHPRSSSHPLRRRSFLQVVEGNTYFTWYASESHMEKETYLCFCGRGGGGGVLCFVFFFSCRYALKLLSLKRRK